MLAALSVYSWFVWETTARRPVSTSLSMGSGRRVELNLGETPVNLQHALRRSRMARGPMRSLVRATATVETMAIPTAAPICNVVLLSP